MWALMKVLKSKYSVTKLLIMVKMWVAKTNVGTDEKHEILAS